MTGTRARVTGLVVLTCWCSMALAAVETVAVLQDFEGEGARNWQRDGDAPVGKGAGATTFLFTHWGGLSVPVDAVPAEADGIAFWIRTDDGASAALTAALYEWEGKRELQAFGIRLWATPAWQRYVVPFAKMRHVWARAGDKKLDLPAVRTVQFQRFLWSPGALASKRVLFDHIEFVKGSTACTVERRDRQVAITVDAAAPPVTVRRFWRAISVADTVEQNSHFEGPEGKAMAVIGADRTFDVARIAWHANRYSSAWVKFTYGAPIYREDENGKPVYDFSGQDALVENIRKCGMRPMFLLHTLPRELASEPPRRPKGGCTAPPRDYAQWHKLVKTFVQHYADKYGVEELATWYWEIWNEPDLWWQNWKSKGKHAGYEAYFELFDHATAAIREVVPNAQVGGPAVAGYPRDYPRQLARHAARGKNYVTGKTGSPLAFISHHCYDGALGQMHKLFEAKTILDKEAPGRKIAIQTTEYGNGIWGVQRAGRYQAASLCQTIDACAYAARRNAAPMAWLFWFGTMRSFSSDCDAFFTTPHSKARYQITTLFLNVRDTVFAKPVYNAYRALNHVDTRWLKVEGTQVGDLVGAFATLADDGSRLSILVYSHDRLDLDAAKRPQPVALTVRGLPFGGKVHLRQFRIDSAHSDVYAAWKAAGSPKPKAISPEQVRAIKAHDALEAGAPDQTLTLEKGGSWTTKLELEPHAVALYVLSPQR